MEEVKATPLAKLLVKGLSVILVLTYAYFKLREFDEVASNKFWWMFATVLLLSIGAILFEYFKTRKK